MAVTFRAASTAYSATSVPKPAGVVAGDLLLAFVAATDSTTPTPPAGWSSVRRTIGGPFTVGMEVFAKTATASEPSSYTFLSSGFNGTAITLVAYSDAAVDVSSGQASGGEVTQIVAPSVTTTGATRTVVGAFFVNKSANVSTPAGTTSRAAIEATAQNASMRVVDFAQASAGATGDKTATVNNAGYNIGQQVAIYVPNQAPNAPILTAPADGAGIDRNSVNRFDWDFSDPDAGDSQSKFNLYHRPIGAPSWTTVTQTTPNTYWDAPAATFAAGDHEWQVETYDAQGVLGARSASKFFTAGDAPPAPTITAPVNGATFSQSETVTWSAPEQDAYQLRILDAADAVVSDTGEVASATARSRAVEFPVNNVARKIQVRVKDGGLWSPYYTISGNVSWTPPATPVVSLLADDGAGALVVTITNPVPTGDQPPVNYNDIYINDGDGEIRVATMVTPNTSWTYWLPKSGRDYTGNVRAVAVADNGITASSS